MILGVNVHKMMLTNLTLGHTLSFYGVLPDTITESHQANFQLVDIKSRSNPLASYDNGSARTVTINVDICEDYISQFNGGYADIREFVAKIKALTYPEYYGLIVKAPSVLLRVGTFFRMRGYCTNVEVIWHRPIRDERYLWVTLSFTISEALHKAWKASEIFNQEDMRRVQ